MNPLPIKTPILRREAHKKHDNVKNPKELMEIGMIKDYKSIGIKLRGLSLEVVI